MTWEEYAFGLSLLVAGLILECAIDIWREQPRECHECKTRRLIAKYGPEWLGDEK